MTIFKAYDIRGIYPSELNEETAYKIGRAFVTFMKCKEVVVGRDIRLSSDSLFEALTKGINDQGANVIDVGLTSTPMFYFAAHNAKAAIMVTASHNPKEYNGFKLCRENSIPIGGDTGIKDIQKLVEKNVFEEAEEKGTITKKDVMEDFVNHNLKFAKGIKKLKIVADFANAMGALTFPKVFEKIDCEFIYLYDELDGTFPNHPADPLKPENVRELQKKVVEEKADLGIAPDGDADRCILIDEKGNYISGDLITALIAKELLKENPNQKILYDLRSSWAVKEEIEAAGGTPIMCRVGHAFIKKQMREEDALFAGELSGHFYYKDSFFTESSIISSLLIMRMISEENKPLSELVAPLKRYHKSEEISFEVEDKIAKIKELEEYFKDAKQISHLDGIKMEYDDWWFNVRPSNTEPLL
ncbi:phosphomannomutase/phosphoglucomutase, partial [Candidatus Woesearchaeota archaeon]|nr:phosphomannomutase/phosphoglucomutase [Candidatus Woesearchaeota archaeon]